MQRGSGVVVGWRFTAFYAVVVTVAGVVFVLHVPQALAQAGEPGLWVMTVLAAVAGTQAFTAVVGPMRTPVVVTPTISFGFAILICWGLGPALVAQAASVVVVAWRLREAAAGAVQAAARHALALGAASSVLWLRRPDPFQTEAAGDLPVDTLTAVAAGILWLAVYGVLVFAGDWLGRGRPGWVAAAGVRDRLLFLSALLVLSPVLAIAAYINVVFVPLVLIPLAAVHRMARLSALRDKATRTDSLTGLDNRAGLRAAYGQLVGVRPDLAEPAGEVSLLLLDLDRFKQVNDTLGHDIGDRLLTVVAGRLPTVDGPIRSVARLGGDEFAVLVTGTEVREVAERIGAAIREPVHLEGLRLDTSASVGIACHTGEDDFASLLRRADIAMYEAKQCGDAVAVYRTQADRGSSERIALLADLRTAIESSSPELSVLYQPQVSLATGQMEAVEALLRWHHPRHGLIPTTDLIALAEHTAQMSALTARVIELVAAQVAVWQAEGLRLRTSINISARDLHSQELPSHLTHVLGRHHLNPRLVQLEITETALLTDIRHTNGPLQRLVDHGIAIALDDFGTGYSSLQHLRHLPITEIKIDRCFVAGMTENTDDYAIVRATIGLARSLNVRTVAEGVENAATWQRLAATGCDLVQGWHTAPAMPGAQITTWRPHPEPQLQRT